jgi:hypothetical protein
MRSLYTYLGYEYRPYEDVEEDNIKIFHECYRDGKRISMPQEFYNHSPYSYMDCDQFVKHVQTIEVFVQG